MAFVLIWFVFIALLALWSLAAWALHAVAVWSFSNVGGLSGVASSGVSIRLPDWLAPWVPAEVAQLWGALVAGLGPLSDALLQAAPALAGGVTVATWVVWGIGSGLLLLLGAGTHVLVALWRRRGGRVRINHRRVTAG
ncbi:hypothetical protein [Polaromonas sp. YR568]|uniref:hypothetical protein n=1 Tax=Polaromonas sp. YR568 TaxID=1855301 RepID=UPI003137A587